MSKITDRHRSSGKITSVWSGDNDHGGLSAFVYLDYNEGSSQGFGGLMLDEEGVFNFLNEICKTFGVKNIKQLKGKPCWILKSFGDWSDTIEGIEDKKSGRRFTITGFRKKYFPDSEYIDVLFWKKSNLESTISWAIRRMEDAKQELKTLESRYVDWETA